MGGSHLPPLMAFRHMVLRCRIRYLYSYQKQGIRRDVLFFAFQRWLDSNESGALREPAAHPQDRKGV